MPSTSASRYSTTASGANSRRYRDAAALPNSSCPSGAASAQQRPATDAPNSSPARRHRSVRLRMRRTSRAARQRASSGTSRSERDWSSTAGNIITGNTMPWIVP